MNSGILVFGDAVAEISVRVDTLPGRGGDTSAYEPLLTMGGSAANTAVAAAAAGADVKMLANVGDDQFGDMIIESLTGVDASLVGRLPGPSPLVIVLVSPDGEKSMISARGPAAEPSPVPSDLPGIEHLHLSGYSFQDAGSAQTARELISLARERGWTVSLTGSAQFHDANDLTGIDYLFVNAAEANALSGQAGGKHAGAALGKRVPHVVVTHGAAGCTVFTGDSSTHLDAVRVEDIVDTTGAGDALAGATIALVLAGEPFIDGVVSGIEAAARSITRRGGH